MEKIELGPTPTNESCAMVGDESYDLLSIRECGAFKRQLERTYRQAHGDRPLPDGCKIVVVTNHHDFGLYREVAVKFDYDSVHATDVAFWFESNVPELWDDEARRELER